MKLSEVLQLDLRVKGNEAKLRGALEQLPFFKNSDDIYAIKVEDLEAAMWKMCKKYPIGLSYIMTGKPDEAYYSFMIRRSDNYEMLKTVFGSTLFEGLAKTVLFMHAYIINVIKKEES